LILLERVKASIPKSSGILAVGMAAGTTLLRIGTAAIALVTKPAFFKKGSPGVSMFLSNPAYLI
jgi:hypothetical protein